MQPINLRLVLFIALWTALSLRRLLITPVNGPSLRKHAIELVIIAVITWGHHTILTNKNQRAVWKMASYMVLAFGLLLLHDVMTFYTARSTILGGICFALSIPCIALWFTEYTKPDDCP